MIITPLEMATFDAATAGRATYIGETTEGKSVLYDPHSDGHLLVKGAGPRPVGVITAVARNLKSQEYEVWAVTDRPHPNTPDLFSDVADESVYSGGDFLRLARRFTSESDTDLKVVLILYRREFVPLTLRQRWRDWLAIWKLRDWVVANDLVNPQRGEPASYPDRVILGLPLENFDDIADTIVSSTRGREIEPWHLSITDLEPDNDEPITVNYRVKEGEKYNPYTKKLTLHV